MAVPKKRKLKSADRRGGPSSRDMRGRVWDILAKGKQEQSVVDPEMLCRPDTDDSVKQIRFLPNDAGEPQPGWHPQGAGGPTSADNHAGNDAVPPAVNVLSASGRQVVPPLISRQSLSRVLRLICAGLLNPRRGSPAWGLGGDPRRPASQGFPLVSQAPDDLIRLPLGAAGRKPVPVPVPFAPEPFPPGLASAWISGDLPDEPVGLLLVTARLTLPPIGKTL